MSHDPTLAGRCAAVPGRKHDRHKAIFRRCCDATIRKCRPAATGFRLMLNCDRRRLPPCSCANEAVKGVKAGAFGLLECDGAKALQACGCGGQRGIRTLGRLSPTHAFQACAIDHSATCPFHERHEASPSRRLVVRREARLIEQADAWGKRRIADEPAECDYCRFAEAQKAKKRSMSGRDAACGT